MKLLILSLLSSILISFTSVSEKPPRVKITVVSEDNEIVEGAKVTIYKNHETYKTEKDGVASGTTNKKGYIEFKNLEEKVYYIHVKKGDLNNNQGDSQTDTLKSANKNRFEIMID